MTVFVYVNTGKQVGDRDHLKIFASADAAEPGLLRTTPKALPQHRLRHACHLGAGDRLAGARVTLERPQCGAGVH